MIAPSADNLYLGAGELLFNRFDDDGLPTGFTHMGNVETFELTTADDRIQKFSSMRKSRPLYAERTRRRNVQLRMVCDEFNAENMALAFMGENVPYIQPATAVVDEILVAAASSGISVGVQKGKYYKASKFLIGVATFESNAVGLTIPDDVVVHNARLGTIFIPEDSGVTPGEDLTASFTPTAITSGPNWRRIRGGNKATIKGSLLFLPDTSEGVSEMVQVWNVSITPDGAIGLISEDFAQFALTAGVTEDAEGIYGGSDDEPLYAVSMIPPDA